MAASSRVCVCVCVCVRACLIMAACVPEARHTRPSSPGTHHLELAEPHEGVADVAEDLEPDLLARGRDLVERHPVHLDGGRVLALCSSSRASAGHGSTRSRPPDGPSCEKVGGLLRGQLDDPYPHMCQPILRNETSGDLLVVDVAHIDAEPARLGVLSE